ncbi:MAG TPA: DUF2062 domain-containing protein [Pseudomonadales bacterium]|nr:DUF2062 domain-containing protein [Pseudomonadales bacterium]
MQPFAKFWRERVVAPIIAQLVQGVTPQKMALTIALGFSFGVFPVLGTTTALCAIAAVRLKLNQPVIQLVNWLVYPLQLAWLLIFIRLGEWMMHAPQMSLSLPELIEKFHESPGKFLQEFGMAQLHGVVAWLFIAPFLTAITFSVLQLPLKGLADMQANMARQRRPD